MNEQNSFECEYCDRAIKHDPVRKKVKGELHQFCSQSCFVLWRYDMPKNDRERFYSKFVVSVPASNIDE